MQKHGSKGGLLFKTVLVLAIIEYGFLFGFVILGDIVQISPEVVGDAGFSPQEGVHLAASAGFVALVLVGLAFQVADPIRFSAGLLVTSAAILAVMLSGAIVGNPNNQGGQAGVFDLVNLIFLVPVLLLITLHPQRSALFRKPRVDRSMLVAVVVAAVPFFLYAIDQALTQRNSWPPKSDPHHNAHWLTMANVGFSIPLIASLAALRFPGWKIAAWAAGTLAVILGITSALLPDAASSLGIVGGVISALGGLAFPIWAWTRRHGN